MTSPRFNIASSTTHSSHFPHVDGGSPYMHHQHTSPDASMQLSPTFQNQLDILSPSPSHGAWAGQGLVQKTPSQSLSDVAVATATSRSTSGAATTTVPKSKPSAKSRAKPRAKKDSSKGKSSNGSSTYSASQGVSPQSQAELTKMFLADMGKSGLGSTSKATRPKNTSSLSTKDNASSSGTGGGGTQRKRKRPPPKKKTEKSALSTESVLSKSSSGAHKKSSLTAQLSFPDGTGMEQQPVRAPSRQYNPLNAKGSSLQATKTASITPPLPPQDARFKYQDELRAIMFIQGHRQRDRDTVELLEDLVRQQLLSVAVLAAGNTRLRGARNMTTDDLLFVCRRNKVSAARLAEFVAQKDARKRNWHAGLETRGSARLRSKWLVLTSLNELTSECEVRSPSQGFSDCVDEHVTRNDVAAQGFAQHEQKQLSDAKRMMSFTLKKTKRFREWLNLGSLMEFKANDDFYETMGHLAWMISVEILEISERVMNVLC